MFASEGTTTSPITEVVEGQLVLIAHIYNYKYALRISTENEEPALVVMKPIVSQEDPQSIGIVTDPQLLGGHCLILGSALGTFDIAQAKILYAANVAEPPVRALVLSSLGPAICVQERPRTYGTKECWLLKSGRYAKTFAPAFCLQEWQLGIQQGDKWVSVIQFK
jgi:hypothetical protein